MPKTVTWVLVADGARARVLENSGRGTGLVRAFPDEFIDETAMGKISDIMTDKRGRTHDSAGPGRHGMEPPTDAKRHAKFVFARELARLLDDAAKRHRFDQLILVAAPKSLGDLRAHLSGNVRNRIKAEIDKDLTHVPEHDLSKHLSDVMVL